MTMMIDEANCNGSARSTISIESYSSMVTEYDKPEVE